MILRHTRKVLLAALLCTLVNTVSFAQLDTRFWFAAPEVTALHGGAASRIKHIIVSSIGAPATVTVSIPANPAFVPLVINLAPDATETFDLTDYNDLIENIDPGVVTNKGILIESTDIIAAYFEVVNPSNSDIFALKGRHALGEEFYWPLQTHRSNQTYADPRAYSSMDIVATEDNTTITVVPTVDVAQDGGGVHVAGVPYAVTLNRGQTYSVRSTGETPEEHPAGTHVTSDKPIAVSTKDDSVIETGWDLIGDQITPVDVLGTKYIIMAGSLNDEYAYLIATEDGTQFSVDGVQRPQIYNAGDTAVVDIGALPHLTISSNDKKFYTLHVSGYSGEIGGAVVPPVDQCSGSQQVSFTYRYGANNQRLFINLMVRAGGESSFLFDGAPAPWITPGDFTSVDNGEWSVARFGPFNANDIDIGNHTISNTQSIFHMGYMNATGPGALYGYFSDFEMLETEAVAVLTNNDSVVSCVGQDIQLRVYGGFSYDWSGTNLDTDEDVTSSLDDPTIGSPIVRGNLPAGNYLFQTLVRGSCGLEEGLVDTQLVYVDIVPGVVPVDLVEEFCETSIGSGCVSGFDLTQFTNQFTASDLTAQVTSWQMDVYDEMLMLENFDDERHLNYTSNTASAFNTGATNSYPDLIHPDGTSGVLRYDVRYSAGEFKVQPQAGYSLDLSEGNIFQLLVYNEIKQPWAHSNLTTFSQIGIRLINPLDSVEVIVPMSKNEKWEELTFDFSGAPQIEYNELKVFMVVEDHEQDIFYFDDIRKQVDYQKQVIADPNNVSACNPTMFYALVENDIGCAVESSISPTIKEGTFSVGDMTPVQLCQTDTGKVENFDLASLTAELVGSEGISQGRYIDYWEEIQTEYDSLYENFTDFTGELVWTGVTTDQNKTVSFNVNATNPNPNAVHGDMNVAFIGQQSSNQTYLRADIVNPIDLGDGFVFKLNVAADWNQAWEDEDNRRVHLELRNSNGVVTSSAAVHNADTQNEWEELTFTFNTADTAKSGFDEIAIVFTPVAWGSMTWYIDDFTRQMQPFRGKTSATTDLTIEEDDKYWALVKDLEGCMVEVPVEFDISACSVNASDCADTLCESLPGTASVLGVDLRVYDDSVRNKVATFDVDWFQDEATSNAVADPSNVNVTDGARFYALVTNTETNETAVGEMHFVVRSSPEVELRDSVVCDGDTITLTVTGDHDFVWGAGVAGNTLEVSPSTPTYFAVTATDAFGCEITDSLLVDVNATPVPSLVVVPTVCEGDTFSLVNTAHTGGSYVWTVSGAGATSDASTSEELEVYAGAGEIQLGMTWVNEEGCVYDNPNEATVSVDSLPPTALAGDDISVCIADLVRLNGNDPGPGTGTWSILTGSTSGISINDLNDPNATVSGLANEGDVLIAEWTISHGVCPSSADQMTITGTGLAEPQVTLSADPTGAVCEGTPVTLTAFPVNGGSDPTFAFYDGQGNELQAEGDSTALSLTLIQDSSIQVVMSSNSSCVTIPKDTSEVLDLSVFQLPSAAVAGDDIELCTASGQLSATLPAIGTGSWATTSGISIVDPSLENTVVDDLPVGEVSLVWSVENGTCPVNTDTVVVSRVGELTSPLHGPYFDVCETENVPALDAPQPDGSQNETGTWVIDGAATVLLAELDNPQASLSFTDTGWVRLTWTIENGGLCPASAYTDSFQVVASPSVANAGTDVLICESNGTVDAEVPLVGSLLWEGEGAALLTDVRDPKSTFAGLEPGTQELILSVSTGDECAVSRDTIALTRVQNLTSPIHGPYAPICETELSYPLDAPEPVIGNSETGSWTVDGAGSLGSFDEQNPSATLNVLDTGWVYLTWTIQNGGICPEVSHQDSLYVGVAPSNADAGPDVEVCDADGQLDGVNPLVGVATWGGEGVAFVDDPSDPQSSFSGLTMGSLPLVWTVSTGTICPASQDTMILTSLGEVVAQIDLDALADSVCTGTEFAFEATPLFSGDAPQYVWFVDGVQKDDPTGLEWSAELNDGAWVAVQLTSSLSCASPNVAWDSMQVAVLDPPTPVIEVDTVEICEGGNELVTAVTNGGAVQWSKVDEGTLEGEFASSILLQKPGGYYITESHVVCPDVKSNVVTLVVNEAPEVSAGDDQSMYIGETMVLEGEVNQGTFEWKPAGLLQNANSLTPDFTTEISDFYTFTLVGNNAGCMDSATVTIRVQSPIEIPNTFTPNDDGINDVWEIRGLETHPNALLKVYNRWGNMVYSSSGSMEMWNGTLDGKGLPTATYYYVLDLNEGGEDSDQMAGSVSIVR